VNMSIEHKARVISKGQNKPHGYSHTYKHHGKPGLRGVWEDNDGKNGGLAAELGCGGGSRKR